MFKVFTRCALLASLLCAAVILTACGNSDGGTTGVKPSEAKACLVTNVVADPAILTPPASSSTLSWTASNCKEFSVSYGNLSQKALGTSMVISSITATVEVIVSGTSVDDARGGAVGSAKVTITVLKPVVKAVAPAVQTLWPYAVGTDSLMLAASYNDSSTATLLSFRYGTQAGSLSNSCAVKAANADGLNHTVTCVIRGLTAGTRVWYQAVAQNRDNTVEGDVASTATFSSGPPSGKLLAWFGQPTSSRNNLFFFNADGSGLQAITKDSLSFMGDWSPDSKSIAFRTFAGKALAHSNFCIWDVATGNSRVIVPDRMLNYPSWSPDGERILAIDIQDSTLNVMNKDGSGFVKLLQLLGDLSGPATWSPDGRKILLGIGGKELPAASRGLYLLGADGQALKLLVSMSAGSGSPRWSPNGSYLAYNNNGQISIVRPDGTGFKTLSDKAAALSTPPVWSPDGQYVAFIAAGYSVVYIQRLDGSQAGQFPMLFGTTGELSSWK
jgi:hypothetical protein